jgi:CysZ protein
MDKQGRFGKALGRYPDAVHFIFANGLGWYFIFPLVQHILLIYLSFYSSSQLAEIAQEWIADRIALSEGSSWSTLLSWITGGVVWMVAKLLFFFIYAYLGGYVVIMLLAPVHAFLSERTEMLLSGKFFETDLIQIAYDAGRGALLSLRNMAIELILLASVFVLTIAMGWIPLFGWLLALAGQIFLIGVSSYFYGFSFLYYTVERRHVPLRGTIELMRSHKAEALATGLPFALCLLIPFVGGIIASFLSIVSTVAGTMVAHEILDGE